MRGAGDGAAAAAAVGAERGAPVPLRQGAGALRGALRRRAAARGHGGARPAGLQVTPSPTPHRLAMGLLFAVMSACIVL